MSRESSAQPAFVHDEPRALDGVAGIQRAPVEVIEQCRRPARRLPSAPRAPASENRARSPRCTPSIHSLHVRPEMRMSPRFARSSCAVTMPIIRRADALHRARRLKLRQHRARLEAEPQIRGKRRHRILRSARLAARFRKGRIADRGKALAENIAPHPQRRALPRHGEIHLSLRRVAMPPRKLHARARRLQPFRARLHGVIKRREHPAGAALEPHALVRVEQRAVAIERGERMPPCSRSMPCRSQNGITSSSSVRAVERREVRPACRA